MWKQCLTSSIGVLAFAVFVINTSGAAPQSISINEFVKRVYVHGVPFEEAVQYGSTVTPELIKMLEDPSYAPYWSNVVVTLGMVGDSRAIKPMLKFLQAGTGEIPAELT